MKVISTISWILTSIWGISVLYAFFIPNGSTDAAGQGQESALKGLALVVLLIIVGLNIMPYNWSKVVALIIGVLLMFLLVSIIRN